MQSIDWWFNELKNTDMTIDIYFKDLLKMMLNGTSTLVSSGCPAGYSDFSVGPDKSVYPCQLLYGNKQYYIGSISDETFKFLPYKNPEITGEFIACDDCLARHWCQPCAALNDFFGNVACPPHAECLIRKTVILRIAQWANNELSLPDNKYSSILQTEIAKLN